MYNKLAKKLFDKGIKLSVKHNSIHTAMDEYGESNSMVNSATAGVANMVRSKITTYRNVILPLAKDLESAVRSSSKIVNESFADNITITPHTRSAVRELFDGVDNVDLNVAASYKDLPGNPLIIEYDKKSLTSGFNTLPGRIHTHLKELMMSRDDQYIERLHDKVFSGVSSNNETIMNLGVNVINNHTDISLALYITMVYLTGGEFVANKPTDVTNGRYLFKLRNILLGYLVEYDRVYANYLESETLIIGTTFVTRDKVTINVIGETYDKYLEDNNIDPIIAYGYGILEARSSDVTSIAKAGDFTNNKVTLPGFIAQLEYYQKLYVKMNRVESLKSELQHINILKLAYKTAASKLMEDMSGVALGIADIDINNPKIVMDINARVSEYVGDLGSESLAKVTDVCRVILGGIIFNRPDFIKFVKDMDYYGGVFPKESPEYVATAVAMAITLDILMEQVAVTSNTK